MGIHKYQLASGDFGYEARIRIRGRTVSRKFRRYKQAEAWLRNKQAEKQKGISVDPRSGRVQFGAYAEQWLQTRLANGKPLAPMTLRGYRGLLRRRLLPTFGDVALEGIDPQTVRQWHAQLVATAGPDSAAKSYRLLRAILNTAVADDRIARNPCRIKGAGTEHTPERPLVGTDTVLVIADAIDPRYRALVLLSAFGALRTGELLGLCRHHVDLLHAQVSVRQQAQEVTGTGRVVDGPKSEAGYRKVVVPRFVVDALDEHMAEYSQAGPDGLVFTGPEGGVLYRNALSRAWRAALEKVGLSHLGLHLHDLRHHGATLAARSGITTKELMVRLGHSSPRAALIYQHAVEERDRAAASYMDEQIATLHRTQKASVVELPIRGH